MRFHETDDVPTDETDSPDETESGDDTESTVEAE